MLTPDTRGRTPVAGRIWQYGAAGVALAFFVLHLPYLPQSLEDLDSINFALGLRQFDVAHHQPHPPGYPIFVALAKLVHAIVPSEAAALATVGVCAGALSVFALSVLFARLGPTGTASRRFSFMATVLTVTAPLYWFTAARPLSDTTGLAAALAVQAITLSAEESMTLELAAFLGGLATGIRSQVAWLTLPLLFLALVRLRTTRIAEVIRLGAAALAGILVWLIPLVILSGGPIAYGRVLFGQGAEDLSGVRMLWTTPTPRQLLLALKGAFVDPWGPPIVAAVIIALALCGLVRLVRRNPPLLMTLAAAFGPYLVFDLLFQETATIRYALPLVVPVAFLALWGLEIAGSVPAMVIAACLAAFNAHVGGTSIAAYASEKAPAFRMLDDMSRAVEPLGPPMLAMDRREDLDLRRPIQWMSDRLPPVKGRLPSPATHEWLEVVKHWNQSGHQDEPVWYVADPLRTDIDLFQHAAPQEYPWRLPYPALVGGARPYEMRWYRIARPDWYVGEGWALTPESAGVAEADRRGPGAGPILGWIERSALRGAMVIGGRNLAASGSSARVTVTVDDDPLADAMVSPGAFLFTLPFGSSEPRRPNPGYATLSVRASPGSRVAVEQLDVSAIRPVLGFGNGWHEQEYNPVAGLRWRWLSDRGDVHLRLPPGGDPPSTAVAGYVLHLEGESPMKYFSRPSRLRVQSGKRILVDRVLDGDFSLDSPIAVELMDGTFSVITLETDQTYVPAERSRRTQDRRRLGLRVFKCEVRQVPAVSGPGK